MRKQNLTLVIDEDILLAARKIALEQRTSVNELVREYLADLVGGSDRRNQARTRLKAAMEHGLIDSGSWKWNRDDLYER